MRARIEVDAGICNFLTTVHAISEDDQHVTLDIQTDCDKIAGLGVRIKGQGPVDAFQEMNAAGDSVLMVLARSCLKGCCAGCAVPVGIFKAMQVAAGLALPKDIRIQVQKL